MAFHFVDNTILCKSVKSIAVTVFLVLNHVDFEVAMTELYRLKEWNPESRASSLEKSYELGIEGVTGWMDNKIQAPP